jgi:hypothetical protein
MVREQYRDRQGAGSFVREQYRDRKEAGGVINGWRYSTGAHLPLTRTCYKNSYGR